MKQLRKLSPLNTEMLTNLHNDIFTTCADLLQRDRYFILEDAIIRAGQRKLRDLVQWDVIVSRLEEHFGHPLAQHHRAALRRMTKAPFNPLRVTKDVAKALEGGNGNQSAGYGFLGWPDRQTTERQIESRHHIAQGIDRSADRLQTNLERAPMLSLLPIREESADEQP